MPESNRQRVTCPSCGKGYRWQDKLAGRQVPCKDCGDRFTVPDAPGVGLLVAPAPDRGGYDLDLDERDEPRSQSTPTRAVCPGCGEPVKAGAVICTSCGFNLQTGTPTGTDVKPAIEADPGAGLRPAEQEVLRKHARAEFVYPGIVMGIGAGVMLLTAAVVAGSNPRFDTSASAGVIASTTIGYTLIGAAGALFGKIFAMLLLVSFYGSAFGDLRTALFKLPAIALLVAATAVCFIMLYENWLLSEDLESSGRADARVKGIIALAAAYLTCFPASRVLFDLDGTEANALTIGSLVGIAAGVLMGSAMLFS